MKYLFFVITILFFSCKEKERSFFTNLEANNPFVDTFTLKDLKGFGLSSRPTFINGMSYYLFNKNNNSIFIEGFFRKDHDKLFFLPPASDQEFLFLDLDWNSSNKIVEAPVTTKNSDLFKVEWLGLSYNRDLRDSTFIIKIEGEGALTHSESLIFEVSKDFQIQGIEHVNCKSDTLAITFYPDKKVYYSHFNSATVCL
jgi:hypothetical protein